LLVIAVLGVLGGCTAASQGSRRENRETQAPDAGAARFSADEQQLLMIVNSEREARGLRRVTPRADLACAAARHANDMAARRVCSHTGSGGSTPTDRVRACNGSGWSGEIIACGSRTPRGAADQWIRSARHSAIMFAPDSAFVGVARAGDFWTAVFDRPAGRW
jgi:uncharacterized protein YkwD